MPIADPRSSPAPASPAGGAAPRVLTGTVYITRQVHFNASHRLHNPAQTAEWNEREFGLCNNVNGHGHNYILEVTVAGQPGRDTGYIMDLGELKDILNRAVVDKCDHRHLNLDVDFLQGVIPSTENLVLAFWSQIAPLLPPAARLHRVRLYETPRNFAEYFGPDSDGIAR